MNSNYLPHEIEPKWQEKWENSDLYKADDSSDAEKLYLLIEFPYPSGARLHVGHARSYCALDSVARMKRMQGYNVMYPIGWDAFGLPAENYAIKTGIHPSITVTENIENAKQQLKSWGISFDWSREINTTDPKYYKWTQWIFLQFYKAGLAYRDEIAVNWCPSCKINLANEEVIDGKCERCGHETERKMQKQWLLRITDYAERLLNDLDKVNYRNDIKAQQISWIGKKHGAIIQYKVSNTDYVIECFTTRPETNYGASFIALSPEHDLSLKITTEENKKSVADYIKLTAKKSELERLAGTEDKTGVFSGQYAINELNNEKIPIYISDFVLPTVGTGAIVGVPGHDRRDFQFAKNFNLPIKRVIEQKGMKTSEISNIDAVYEGDGIVVNSGFMNGMSTQDAKEAVISYIEKENIGRSFVDYHLRDWVFSRQHYWGEPIPVIYCNDCGEVPVPEEELPVELPHVEQYEPSNTGESPLAKVEDWVNITCPVCGGKARRETDTMPNWAGSSWYYLRYTDPSNNKRFASESLLDKWLPVDWYNGGMEHTTLHLLYSRFWHKFLFDQGFVPTVEPYTKRTSHGVVYGPDGKRMSKSKGNVINPDDIIDAYGADTLRMYISFIGPFEQNVSWSNEAISGVSKFLNRVWRLSTEVIASGRGKSSEKVLKAIHMLINDIEQDTENLRFNTAVASYMECINKLYIMKDNVGHDALMLLIVVLAPYAPHLAEEVWQMLGHSSSVHRAKWPQIDKDMLKDEIISIPVQLNGKFKLTVEIPSEKITDKEYVTDTAIVALNMREKLTDLDSDNIIYVEGKILNFVI